MKKNIFYHCSITPKLNFFIQKNLKALTQPIPKAREYEICKKHKAVFLIGIGEPKNEGHMMKSIRLWWWATPTYNVFKGLNGDILLWNCTKNAFEISSMGIRVISSAWTTTKIRAMKSKKIILP